VKYIYEECMNEMREYTRHQGFYTPCSIDEHQQLLTKLMLVVSELGEAAEAVRHGDEANFREEIADTFIRLLDLVAHMHIDINQEIATKMEYNWSRPYKHGKKFG